MSAMPFEDFETAYETLATAIDQAGPAREALFLTRLALVLGHELGDIAAFRKPSRPRSTGWNSEPFATILPQGADRSISLMRKARISHGMIGCDCCSA
jgi:hypothetical protein